MQLLYSTFCFVLRETCWVKYHPIIWSVHWEHLPPRLMGYYGGLVFKTSIGPIKRVAWFLKKSESIGCFLSCTQQHHAQYGVILLYVFPSQPMVATLNPPVPCCLRMWAAYLNQPMSGEARKQLRDKAESAGKSLVKKNVNKATNKVTVTLIYIFIYIYIYIHIFIYVYINK